MKKACPFPKVELRKKARQIRKNLPQERRLHAGDKILEILAPRLKEPTLSFASFSDEIDLWPLNELLRERGLLLFPGNNHARLDAFAVRDFARELEKAKMNILVPREEVCTRVLLGSIAVVLVPALGFDRKGGRIGYGGGFYDKLLANLNKDTKKIGVGFIEQLFLQELPHEKHDMYVDELILV